MVIVNLFLSKEFLRESMIGLAMFDDFKMLVEVLLFDSLTQKINQGLINSEAFWCV